MGTFITFIETMQKPFDLRGYYFLGLELDRYAHFFLAVIVFLIFSKFKKRKLGIIVVVSLVFLKEIIDLGVVYYHEPIKADIWMDTSIDILLGLFGLVFAIKLSHFKSKIV